MRAVPVIVIEGEDRRRAIGVRALPARHGTAKRVLVDPEPANARFQRGGGHAEHLRRALDAVYPAPARRERLFDLLALVTGTILPGGNGFGAEGGELEIG